MLAIPACPPIPRLTLLGMSIVVVIVLVCDLVLLVATLRAALRGAATEAVRAALATGAILVGILMLGTLAFIVFLDLQDNSFLLAGCAIFTGDTLAERDMHMFHALEAVVAAIPVVAIVMTMAAILFAHLARHPHAR